jgi:hypothetical protein
VDVVRCCPACDGLVDDELRCPSCGPVESWLVKVRGETVAIGFAPPPCHGRRRRPRPNVYREDLLEGLRAIAAGRPVRERPTLALPIPAREPAE